MRNLPQIEENERLTHGEGDARPTHRRVCAHLRCNEEQLQRDGDDTGDEPSGHGRQRVFASEKHPLERVCGAEHGQSRAPQHRVRAQQRLDLSRHHHNFANGSVQRLQSDRKPETGDERRHHAHAHRLFHAFRHRGVDVFKLGARRTHRRRHHDAKREAHLLDEPEQRRRRRERG